MECWIKMNNDLALALAAITIVIALLFVLKRYGFIFSPHIARALRDTKYVDFKVIRNSTSEADIIEMWYNGTRIFVYDWIRGEDAYHGLKIGQIHAKYTQWARGKYYPEDNIIG
jgi:hypothetical protein